MCAEVEREREREIEGPGDMFACGRVEWRLEVLAPAQFQLGTGEPRHSRAGATTANPVWGDAGCLAPSVVARWQRAVAPLESGVTAGTAVLRVPLDGSVPLLHGSRPAGL